MGSEEIFRYLEAILVEEAKEEISKHKQLSAAFYITDTLMSDIIRISSNRAFNILAARFSQNFSLMNSPNDQCPEDIPAGHDHSSEWLNDAARSVIIVTVKSVLLSIEELLTVYHIIPQRVFETGGDYHREGRSTLKIKHDGGSSIFRPVPPLASRLLHMAYAIALDGEAPRPDIYSYPHRTTSQSSLSAFLDEDAAAIEADDTYYFSCGALAAAALAIGATDLHVENILSAQNVPRPIDVEMIGHWRLDGQPLTLKDTGLVGIGPLSGFGFGGIVNRSGVFVRQEGLSPRVDFVVRDHLKANLRSGQASPRREFVINAICSGFSDGAEKLRSNIDYFINFLTASIVGGHLGKTTRIIIRPTVLYNSILNRMTTIDIDEPSQIKDYIYKALTSSPTSIWPQAPHNIVMAEIDDLMRFDIPYFSLNSSSGAIIQSNGATLDVAPLPSISQLLPRLLRDMDRLDVAANLELIRQSFSG